jgi:starch synthase
LGLPGLERIPLMGVVTRLVDQKGIDILINAVRHILWHRQAQFVVLGSGMENFEQGMRQIAADYRGKAVALLTFNEPLSERIYAGSDMFLMPSLFEPCGIGQMLAMRYGSLPIVRKVGGLADTVDPRSGFLFGPYDTGALIGTIEKALDTFAQPEVWRRMQISAMSKDFAWEQSARRYLDLYRLSVDVHRAYA